MSIVDRLNSISNLQSVGACSDSQLKEAQSKLQMIFPEEYVEYVTNFGAICFLGTEWTGLNINGYFNTVTATEMEKSVNDAFPQKHFVLEDLCIDAKKVIVNEQGQVFLLQYENIELICESISEYLDICIKRSSEI